MPALSWKQQPPSGKFDAIVIGSGMGGLTAAVLLAKEGRKRVLVLEQHYRLGGYTHTFTRPGYEWDVGVHYVGQVGEKGQLRGAYERLTEGRLRWAALPDVYDRVELGGRGYDFPSGTRRWLERMVQYFPREEVALRRYVTLAKETALQSSGFFLARAFPPAVTRALHGTVSRGFLSRARRTTAQVLGELTVNEELKAVLTGQYGDYGLPPSRSSWAMHATLVTHYFGGGWYPVGGSAAFVEAMAPVIEAHGGHLATYARVKALAVEGGKVVGVRMEDETELRAPVVISDAGLFNTARLLPPEQVPAEWSRALTTVSRSSSYFSLCLGFRQTDAELGLGGTNLWLYPDEKHDHNVARFEADPSAPFPMVYVSFPSAKDPEWSRRFPGRATVDVITMAKFDWFSRWQDTRWKKRGADYEAFKQEMAERLLEVVFRRLPQLRGKVDAMEATTPLTTAHFAGHQRGELYGLDHTPERYSFELHPRGGVPGLLLTGVDTMTCGVSGAMVSGVLTAGAVVGPWAAIKTLRPA
ncbi:MAG: phytoene desaturase family protein [Myxococcota bacterium]